MRNKTLGNTALVLAALQVLLVMASWIVSAAMPETHVRSLLGSEGIRWFFGTFADNLATPLLADVILLLIGGGAMAFSGLGTTIVRACHHRRLRYLERSALLVVVAEAVLIIVAEVLLATVPHAILLSVTGHLFSSSFSESIIPVIAFAMLVCSLSFGVVSGRLNTVEQAYKAMIYGIKNCAWIFPLYVLAVELYFSVEFVFQL